MPCIKCEGGKWKWGRNGRCIYETEAACKAANEGSRTVACNCDQRKTIELGGKTYELWDHAEIVEQIGAKKSLPENAYGWGGDWGIKAKDQDDDDDDDPDDDSQDIRQRRVPVRLTQEIRDRDNDIITVGGSDGKGLDIRRFKKDNPMFLFGHRASELDTVLGRVENVKKQKGADGIRVVDGEGTFLPRDLSPLADTAFRLMTMKPRVLNMTSIGFNFGDVEIDRDLLESEDKFGLKIMTSELLELSVVPVGSNPGALVLAKSVGIDLKPLKTYLEETLDKHQGNRVAKWLTVKDIEECYTVCNSGARTFLNPGADQGSHDPVRQPMTTAGADGALAQRLLEAEEQGGRIMATPRFDAEGKIVGLDFEDGEVKAAPNQSGAPGPKGPVQAKAGTSGAGAPANPEGSAGVTPPTEKGKTFKVAGKDYFIPDGYSMTMTGEEVNIVPTDLVQAGDGGKGSKTDGDDDAVVIEFIDDDDEGSKASGPKTPTEVAKAALTEVVTQVVNKAIDQKTGRVS